MHTKFYRPKSTSSRITKKFNGTERTKYSIANPNEESENIFDYPLEKGIKPEEYPNREDFNDIFTTPINHQNARFRKPQDVEPKEPVSVENQFKRQKAGYQSRVSSLVPVKNQEKGSCYSYKVKEPKRTPKINFYKAINDQNKNSDKDLHPRKEYGHKEDETSNLLNFSEPKKPIYPRKSLNQPRGSRNNNQPGLTETKRILK